ncbi:hypothetical protein [[Eubacterium] cellulosolvens]
MDRIIMLKQNIKRTTINRLLVLAIIFVSAGSILLFGLGLNRTYSTDVSLRELNEHPSNYVNKKVKAVGYLIKHTAPHFGDTYILCEGDPRNLYFAYNPCIAITGTTSIIDPYIGFIYNGTNYEVALSPCSFAVPCRVIVTGVFIDRNEIVDASQYAIEVSSVTFTE